MARQINNDKALIRYLLGDASDEEKIRLEEEFFGDDTFFEQLLAVEDDLIDAYVQGELSASDRERFERSFLTTPRRRERVEFARALRGFVAEAPAATTPVRREQTFADPARVSWWQSVLGLFSNQNQGLGVAFATVALAVVLGSAGVLVVLQRDAPEQVAKQEAPPQKEQEGQPRVAEENPPSERPGEAARPEDGSANSPPKQGAAEPSPMQQRNRSQNRDPRSQVPAKPPPQPGIAMFVLMPGLVRGGGAANKLEIAPGTSQLRLRVDLEKDAYRSYRAVLQTADGDEVWSGRAAQAQRIGSGGAVVLRVPAELLSKGDYILTLSGVTAGGTVEEVGEYSLSVVRR